MSDDKILAGRVTCAILGHAWTWEQSRSGKIDVATRLNPIDTDIIERVRCKRCRLFLADMEHTNIKDFFRGMQEASGNDR